MLVRLIHLYTQHARNGRREAMNVVLGTLCERQLSMDLPRMICHGAIPTILHFWRQKCMDGSGGGEESVQVMGRW